MKHWRWIVAMLAVAVALVVELAPGAFAAGEKLGEQPGIVPQEGQWIWQHPKVVQPDGVVFGMTYGDWSVAWWQWALAIPWSTHPYNDPTGANCLQGQSTSPVFFLVGGNDVTRHCTIPAGKTLVFPIINAECSTVEPPPFYGKDAIELRNCAAYWANAVGVDTLEFTIDGKRVKNLAHFRAQSPVFDFTMPLNDNMFGVPNVTAGTSVSDGYWVIVEPLSPGHHVIHLEAAHIREPCPTCFQNATYHLTVTK
jgi:hypothetical protein